MTHAKLLMRGHGLQEPSPDARDYRLGSSALPLFPQSQECSVWGPSTCLGRSFGYVACGSGHCRGQRPNRRQTGIRRCRNQVFTPEAFTTTPYAMCAALMISAANTAPSSGPTIGIGAYAQSEA